MTYTPTNWVPHETVISADRMNHLEQGIAAFYPQETIIAPEQTVTITAETDPEAGVPITLAEGIDLSTFGRADLEALSVSINGEAVTSDAGRWSIDVDGGVVLMRPVADPDAPNVLIGFALSAANPDTQAVLPGDYTVEIKRTVTEVPVLGAFPVIAGADRDTIDAPVDEVDAAMTAGCVLLYAKLPDRRDGFAFGILVGGLAYYATLTSGSFGWSATTVRPENGKYVIGGFA